MLFPRSKERGLIEADDNNWHHVVVTLAFRVQKNAASLKPLWPIVSGVADVCLSAFKRTRPH